MPRSLSLVPIITNPDQWPPAVRRHILEERAIQRNVPDEFWLALRAWGGGRPHVAPGEEWYKDFEPYYRPKLRGWRLVGQGNMPKSVVGPNESKFTRGRKLAFVVDGWLDSPLAGS